MVFRAVFHFIKEYWLPILVVALGAALALVYNNNLNAARKEGYNKARAEYAEASRVADKNMRDMITQIDKEWTEKNEVARKENDDLRASIATGHSRVYIKATCPTEGSNGASLDNDATYAQLDGATAQRIIDIANDGDEAIRQLSAAQDILRSLSLKEGK